MSDFDWDAYFGDLDESIQPNAELLKRLEGLTPEDQVKAPFYQFTNRIQSAYFARKADELIRAHEYGSQSLVVSSEADILDRPSPSWHIEGLIQENTICLLAGPGGIGKSFLALGMARAIASGAPFFGRKTKRGRVLYVAAEGVAAFGDRVRAWNDAHRSLTVPPNAITYVEAGVNLQVEESLAQVRELIETGEYSLVILDTLNQLAYFENENSNSEAGDVFRNIQSLRTVREGTSILVIDHTPVNGGKARGASAKRDNSDTVIMAIPAGEGGRDGFSLSTQSADGGKQKDGTEIAWHGFGLQSVGNSAVVVNNGGKRPLSPYWAQSLVILQDGAAHSTSEIRQACGIDGDIRSAEGKRLKREIDHWEDAGLVVRSGTKTRPMYALTAQAKAVLQ